MTHIISDILRHKIADNILLLQGPVGYFFSDLHGHLKQYGAKNIIKINFNAGDDFYYKHQPTIKYNKPFHQLEAFYTQIIKSRNIDAVYLFGDCRFIHHIAINVFKKHHIPYYVFEEGYIRPNYITMEQGGVNGNSSLKITSIGKVPDFECHKYQAILGRNPSKNAPMGYGSFRKMVLWGFIYFCMCRLKRYQYPFYIHHKSVSPFEIALWILSFMRKYCYRIPDFKKQNFILSNLSKRYFVVPLQVYNDAQIFNHSPFHDVTDFIETVLESFANHAPKGIYLVIKHHPLDRGHRHYKQFIKNRSKQLGIKKRVIYVHEVSLPKILRHAKGVITINSTVGLSALHHQTPVKVLGNAFYDTGGLTYQGSLARFWKQPGKVIESNFVKYRKYIIIKSQILGSFYSKIFNIKV
ncbi:MAG: capsular polysaccharide export protein [Alphaproteobacteria bacterium]|jgi:capsular polysaccharide export protein